MAWGDLPQPDGGGSKLNGAMREAPCDANRGAEEGFFEELTAAVRS
jgi:hypothetical protein